MMDIDRRMAALQDRISAVLAEVRVIVRELVTEEEVRFLVAQQLPDLGSAALSALIELIRESEHPHEVRVLAAFAALALGERQLSVPVLIAEIADDRGYAPLAATNLAGAGIAEATTPIIDAIRRTDNPDKAATLLDALHALGADLPDDVWRSARRTPRASYSSR